MRIMQPRNYYSDFICQVQSGYAPLLVYFIPNYQSTTAHYHWTFGDGIESSIRNPSHIFTNPGIYSVSLRITIDNFTEERTKKNFIEVKLSPTNQSKNEEHQSFELNQLKNLNADFTCQVRSGYAPLLVYFIPEYQSKEAVYHWNFGNGEESDIRNPSHVFRNGGTYSVSLRITLDGFSVEMKKENIIEVKIDSLT